MVHHRHTEVCERVVSLAYKGSRFHEYVLTLTFLDVPSIR